MKPPSRRLIVQWVVAAWSTLPKEIILNSFCTINIEVDGSEDPKYYFFKKGKACEAGAEQQKMQLSVLDEPSLPNPLWKSMILPQRK